MVEFLQMRLNRLRQRLRPFIIIGLGLLMILLSSAGRPALANPTLRGASGLLGSAVSVTTGFGPGVDGRVHRVMTRAERSIDRLAAMAGQVGRLWVWLVLSAGVFLLVAAVSSVADVRMFDLRRQGPGALARYLAHGMRTFFRILRDRHTPYLARAVLVMALVYWLLPSDLIADDSVLPGFLDDVVVVILGAKAFMYLCPDSLVARHAAAVHAPQAATL